MFEVSFAEQTLESTQISDWFSKFKSGVTSMEDAGNFRTFPSTKEVQWFTWTF